MKSCQWCGLPGARPCGGAGAEYQQMALCPRCTMALVDGAVACRDTDGAMVFEAALRQRTDRLVELVLAEGGEDAFPPLVTQAELVRTASRILLALGAGNPAGDGYGAWPQDVLIPPVRDQRPPAETPPEVAWRQLTVLAQFLCAECRKGELRCNEESGVVECPECGRQHRLRVVIDALPRV